MSPRWFALLLLLLASCTPPPLPEVSDEPFTAAEGTCETSTDPTKYAACSTGSGIFGEWTLDERNRPAYRYRFDQLNDERASFRNSEGLDRRDHWFAIGNSRVNVMAFNDGHVEVVDQDRGITHWNAYDESRKNYSGGFGWIDDGEKSWCTGWKWRPQPSRTVREFGMVAALYELEHRGVKSSRRLFSPPGDDAVLISEVTLTNTSKRRRTLSHYEFWDVARRNIEINWIVSGDLTPDIPRDARAKRDAQNADFREEVRWDAANRAVTLRRTPNASITRPDAGAPDPRDWYPADPFLAVLEGDVDGLYTEQGAFFGDGDPSAPAAIAARTPSPPVDGVVGRTTSGNGQSRAFIVRSPVTLEPGESRTLRFAFGTTPHGAPLALSDRWKTVSPQDAQDAVDPHLLRFTTPAAPHLQRELAWHAAQLEASVGRREYQGQHIVPQGSAYLYLHGADGAARDLGLFTLPLVYTHPSLAREELTFYMQTHIGDDRRFSYAFQGHGMLDDALHLHRAPSDLDLFFLLALTEYVYATGDRTIFDSPVPYWPKEAVAGATGWTHTRDAIRHLFDVVGTGAHGLIRVGTGDWSDGIVATEASNRDLAIREGESVPNTQMALYVLPRVADLIEPRDAALATEIRGKLPALRAAVEATWRSANFGRAYFGDGVLFRANSPDLEAQVWPLIARAGFPAPEVEPILVNTVSTRLDSPLGATLWPGGDVWPAISVLWTWGLARSGRMEAAWDHLAKNTMHSHALAFPAVWYGTWSAPDGLSSRSGQSWSSPATPMRDFPVQNNNAHALPLFAAIKAAGVETTAYGLRIAPGQTTRPFSFRSELLDLEWDGARLQGRYSWPALSDDRRPQVELELPADIVHVNGEPVAPQPRVRIAPLTADSPHVRFDVSTR